MLPETASLWPLFQLLIRFPGLLKNRDDALASFGLRLLLANLDKTDLLGFANRLRGANSVTAALEILEDKTLTPPAISRTVRDGVRAAQSLTDRYTLIMYWLLRHQKAEELLV